MAQSIRLGDSFQLLSIHSEERTAGTGQNNSLDFLFAVTAHQALKNRRMLGVHRDNFRATGLCLSHYQLAGADQGFLVGKTDTLACANGRQGGLQAYHTHHGSNHAVGIFNGCGFNEALFSPTDANGQICDFFLQLRSCLFCSHNRQRRAVLTALLCHSLHAGAGSKRRYGDMQIVDNIQGLPADGTGRTENTDTLYHLISPPLGYIA